MDKEIKTEGLTDEELDSVAGGGGNKPPHEDSKYGYCGGCGFKDIFGKFFNVEHMRLQCPRCSSTKIIGTNKE